MDKFRGRALDDETWVYGDLLRRENHLTGTNAEIEIFSFRQDVTTIIAGKRGNLKGYWPVDPETVGIFTTKQCSKGKDVYFGDIIRIEEEDPEGGPDEMRWYVVWWISEWCMFALLDYGEMIAYKGQGVEGINMQFYWTYPIERIGEDKYFLCGNIWDNPGEKQLRK